MPLQFTWAAVAAYCGHESGRPAQHFGHHEHRHAHAALALAIDATDALAALDADVADVADDADPASGATTLDVADCGSHGQLALVLPVSADLTLQMSGSRSAEWCTTAAAAPHPSRPERPRWPAHA